MYALSGEATLLMYALLGEATLLFFVFISLLNRVNFERKEFALESKFFPLNVAASLDRLHHQENQLEGHKSCFPLLPLNLKIRQLQ